MRFVPLLVDAVIFLRHKPRPKLYSAAIRCFSVQIILVENGHGDHIGAAEPEMQADGPPIRG